MMNLCFPRQVLLGKYETSCHWSRLLYKKVHHVFVKKWYVIKFVEFDWSSVWYFILAYRGTLILLWYSILVYLLWCSILVCLSRLNMSKLSGWPPNFWNHWILIIELLKVWFWPLNYLKFRFWVIPLDLIVKYDKFEYLHDSWDKKKGHS